MASPGTAVVSSLHHALARNAQTLAPYLLPFLLGSAAPLRAELVAAQINEVNLADRVGGSDSISGMGDWLLSNGVLCAAVSGAGHETGLSVTGGWLVDLGHCGLDDDQLTYTHLLPMMKRESILPLVGIDALVADTEASIIVRRSDGALQASIRYTLKKSEPQRLFVSTELQRIAPGAELSMVGQLWLHPHRSMVPYSVNTRDVSRSTGYVHPHFDIDDRSSTLNAMLDSDLTVLVGQAGAGPGISYGILSGPAALIEAGGSRRRVSQYTLVEADFTNQLWLTRPLWFGAEGKPGRLQMLQSFFMDLEPGETLQLEQEIIVGELADVASVTNRVYEGVWLRGQLDTPHGRIAVYDESGHPVTEARPDAQGEFQIRMPMAMRRCELVVRTPWQSERRIAVELGDRDRRLEPIVTGAPGTVRLPRGVPVRLIFVGIEGTPDPQLSAAAGAYSPPVEDRPGGTLSPLQSNNLSLNGLVTERRTLLLAPGAYRVYASRGLEYTVEQQDIRVEAGQTVDLRFPPLRKVVDSRGWVSADFHVHSGYSFDSVLSPNQRLSSFVAQGADVLVATEHDVVVDLSEHVSRMGLDEWLTVVSGVEVTGMARAGAAPRTIGHINVFPLRRDERAFAGGLPMHEGKRLRQVMAEIKATAPATFIQLNHPRSAHSVGEDLAFFDHLSVGEHFNPAMSLNNVQNRPLVERDEKTGLRDLDFDILELANGSSLPEYQLVRADWLSLLLQGEYRPAVASSDSHQLRDPVAIPRSYVAYEGPVRHPVDVQAMLAAVRRGEVMGSSGPFPRLELENDRGETRGVGGTLVGRRFTLRVSAQAAPWVDVDQVWVYLNGSVIKGTAIKAGEELSIPIEVEKDSFIFVEFYGHPGEVYRAVAPDHTPMAFTNPVWIDADGDGKWSSPGLLPPPLAIARPRSIPSMAPDAGEAVE